MFGPVEKSSRASGRNVSPGKAHSESDMNNKTICVTVFVRTLLSSLQNQQDQETINHPDSFLYKFELELNECGEAFILNLYNNKQYNNITIKINIFI